jgi:photosystem II stability/assembly factor-like uncharacterized protein
MKRRFFQVALVLVITILASWGYPIQARQTAPASVNFLERKNINFPHGVEAEATETGISLSFAGIYAIDKNTAYLYGQTGLGALLLQTKDAGKHWQESNIDDAGSAVRFVTFNNHQTGWALVEYYQGEAGGPITLYRTTNAGQTWKSLGEFFNMSRYWELVNVRLFDNKKGQVDIFDYDADRGEPEHVKILTTVNNGSTWKETARLYGKDIKMYRHHGTMLRAGTAESNSDYLQSTGRDGTYWQIEQAADTPQTTVKQRLLGKKLESLNPIPGVWNYQNGRIVPSKPGVTGQ